MGERRAGLGLADIEQRLAALARGLAANGIRLACVFGSAVERPSARDIDIGVWFEKYSFAEYLRTWELASRILGPRRVDVVVLNRANARLKLSALLGGRLLLAATPTTLAEIVTDAVRGYDAALAQLTRLRLRFASFETFRSDVDTRELCVHYLRIALESVLDVCRHFLATVGVSLGELDTTNLIELAAEKGLLEPAFALRIRGMAGMRNAIAHVYWRLDYEAIYAVITGQVQDFDEFARLVRACLDRQRQDPV
jgi:uncharacterized protein YutE (UPF0331/DUF86 family)/predicted nucleotidyltransferase